jgi:hypothetical protein
MTLGDFERLRHDALLAPGANIEKQRKFLLRGLDPEDGVARGYRYLSEHPLDKKPLSLEADLEGHLLAFHDRQLVFFDTNFRKIRRFALNRYAFGLLWKTYRQWKRPRWKLHWVWDCLMPRFPLSMLLAYGTILGAGEAKDWIVSLAGKHPYGLSGSCLVLAAGLVWLNIHDKLGRGEHGLRLLFRTILVMVPITFWGYLLNWAITLLSPEIVVDSAKAIAGPFEPGVVGVTSVATVLAILGQYVFSGGSSIAEPL